MEAIEFPYQRIIVVGTSGSGKSTLAETLANRLNLEFIELDALHWLPEWQPVSDEEMRARVDQATRAPRWTLAGNYSIARDVSWPRAEALIWLDYSFWTIFWRLWRRTFRRWWTQELLWGTNREQFLRQFFIWSPEDSIFRWLFDTYPRRKREYPQLFSLPQYAHLKIIHMRTPAETDAFLRALPEQKKK